MTSQEDNNPLKESIIPMKSLIIFISFVCLSVSSSCIEEESGSEANQEKPRDNKFLVPTEAQSSTQMKQHAAADKKLIPTKDTK
jgi:hypothetical protein